MRKKRVLSPHTQEIIERPSGVGDETAAFIGLIEDVEAKALQEEQVEDSPDPPPLDPVLEPLPESATVDAYLRKQVMQEMYGTENPSDYERNLQAIKDRL